MKKPKFLLLFFLFLFLALPASSQDENNGYIESGNQVNNAFYFVVDKIIDLQGYFITQARGIGRIVFLIALLSAGLNHVLTGTGLKENLIKIFKATVFFLIVINFYPAIIGEITRITIDYALGSIYPSVDSYFSEVEKEISTSYTTAIYVGNDSFGTSGHDLSSGKDLNIDKTGKITLNARNTMVLKIIRDKSHLFNDLTMTRKKGNLTYTTIAPANMFKILLLISGDMIEFGDKKERASLLPDVARTLKGFICAGFVIATGVFALLEYLICFLEFMLVASVGVILFPLSIWEGSKFLSEKFIGAIVGFFIKMLFCNLAIFLLLYGFITIFYTFSENGFQGNADQIVFIVFTCLLFFYICKSAPAIAQSLLTGTPSLSASGAISAVGGAVAAVGSTMGLAGKVARGAGNVGGAVAGGVAKGGFALGGMMNEANAAKTAAMQEVKNFGGSFKQMKEIGNEAFASSITDSAKDSFKSAGLGLTRSLLGDKRGAGGSSGGGGTNPHSWTQSFLNDRGSDGRSHQTIGEHMDKRREEGRTRGNNFVSDYISKDPKMSANRESQIVEKQINEMHEKRQKETNPSK